MKSQRLLLICPSLPQTSTVGRILTRLGHQVHVARSGEEGLKTVEAFQFDLVLLQDPMPEGAAWEWFYRMDKQARHRTVVVTAAPNPLMVWQRNYPEAKEILEFPSSSEELAAALCELLMTENSHQIGLDRAFLPN